MDKKLLFKPNQLIMSSAKDIGVLQRKAYNVILQDAREHLLKNPKETEFYFSIADLKRRAGIKATDNKKVKDSLKKLMSVNVDIIKDNPDDWKTFNLISEADKEGDQLVIELPRTVRKALIANDYYTPVDLLELARLSGKYAVILYEVYLRFKGKEIPQLTMEEFKELMGVEEGHSYYKNLSLLKKRVIHPALEEIEEVFGLTAEYTMKKKGRQNVGIKINIGKKKEEKKPPKKKPEATPKKPEPREVNPEFMDGGVEERIRKREAAEPGFIAIRDMLKKEGVIK